MADAQRVRVSKRGRVNEGRPTKRTPEVVKIICAAISKGLNDEEAALRAGIEPATLSDWKKESPEFCQAIKQAVALRLEIRLDRIEAGDQGWQGTAWILERVHKERFMRPDLQLAQQINVNVDSKEMTLNPQQLAALSDAYNKEKLSNDPRYQNPPPNPGVPRELEEPNP